MNRNLINDLVRRTAVNDGDLDRLNLTDPMSELLAEVVRQPRTEAPDGGRSPSRPHLASPTWPRVLLSPGLGLLLAAAVLTVVTVSPVRAALESFGETLTGYFDGDNPPGRALDNGDSPPTWLVSGGRSGQRVLASAEGYELYLVRNPSGDYAFGLDNSVGISDSAASWERQFADDSVLILGRGPSKTDAVPLYGITAGDVAAVQIRYEDGPAATAPAETGGFVLMIEPARRPVELVALGGDGQPLQVVDARRYAAAN